MPLTDINVSGKQKENVGVKLALLISRWVNQYRLTTS